MAAQLYHFEEEDDSQASVSNGARSRHVHLCKQAFKLIRGMTACVLSNQWKMAFLVGRADGRNEASLQTDPWSNCVLIHKWRMVFLVGRADGVQRDLQCSGHQCISVDFLYSGLSGVHLVESGREDGGS